jgi:DNA-damage-inducible protein D
MNNIKEYGIEYWKARELMQALVYSKWDNFHKVIKRAMIACENSNNNVSDHFPENGKPITGGNGNIQNVIDYHLSRYACYLIVQNSDLRKV